MTKGLVKLKNFFILVNILFHIQRVNLKSKYFQFPFLLLLFLVETLRL